MISGEPRGVGRMMNASRLLLSLGLWMLILNLLASDLSRERRVVGLGFVDEPRAAWRKGGISFCWLDVKFPTEVIREEI